MFRTLAWMIGLTATTTAVAAENAYKWFPLDYGNEWVFSDGSNSQRMGVDGVSGSYRLLNNFQGANFWTYEKLSASNGLPDIQQYNSGNASWYYLFRFDKPQGTAWSFNLTSASCDTLQAFNEGALASVATPAGIFSDVKGVGYTQPYPSSCAKPPFGEVVLARQVGPVFFQTPSGSQYRLIYGEVNGSVVAAAPYDTMNGGILETTLIVDTDVYQNKPNSIRCITQPCPSNQVDAMIHATLLVKNVSTTTRTWQFNNGQQTDIDLYNSEGDYVTSWSNQVPFTMALSSVTLAPGETKTYSMNLRLVDMNGSQLEGEYWLDTYFLGDYWTYSMLPVTVTVGG